MKAPFITREQGGRHGNAGGRKVFSGVLAPSQYAPAAVAVEAVVRVGMVIGRIGCLLANKRLVAYAGIAERCLCGSRHGRQQRAEAGRLARYGRAEEAPPDNQITIPKNDDRIGSYGGRENESRREEPTSSRARKSRAGVGSARFAGRALEGAANSSPRHVAVITSFGAKIKSAMSVRPQVHLLVQQRVGGRWAP